MRNRVYERTLKFDLRHRREARLNLFGENVKRYLCFLKTLKNSVETKESF